MTDPATRSMIVKTMNEFDRVPNPAEVDGDDVESVDEGSVDTGKSD